MEPGGALRCTPFGFFAAKRQRFVVDDAALRKSHERVVDSVPPRDDNESYSVNGATMPTPVAERKARGEDARAARREELLAAARRVFARQGFRGTTIADIAEEAGIALGTIYLYFPSKDDVFAALNEQLNELIAKALTDVPAAGSLQDVVRARVNNVFAVCAENRDLVQLVVLNTDPESATSQRLRRSDEVRTGPLAKVIEEASSQGWIRQGDPWIMTKLTIGAVSMAVYQAFVLANGRGWEKYQDACADMLVAYFTPQVEGMAEPPRHREGTT